MSSLAGKERARSRLLSRTSFFGGPVSTREASRAPGWEVTAAPRPKAATAQERTKEPSGRQNHRAGHGAIQHSTPENIKGNRFRDSLDFSGLGTAPRPAPTPHKKSSPHASNIKHTPSSSPAKHSSGALRKSVEQRSPRPSSMSVASVSVAGRAAEVARPGHVVKHMQSVAPRTRKGDRARRTALEVSAGMMGRKQLAAASLRSKVDEIVAARKKQQPGGSPAVVRHKMTTEHGLEMHDPFTASGPSTAPSHRSKSAPAPRKTAVSSSAGAATLHLVRRKQPVSGSATTQARETAQLRSSNAQQKTAASGNPTMRGTFYGSQQPPSGLQRKRRLSLEEEEGYDDDFVDDDEGAGDWRSALRDALGGYDPTKFADVDRMDDRMMEVSRYSDIAQEEQRSLRIAREVDRREAEAEALRIARKEDSKRKKRCASAFLDDD